LSDRRRASKVSVTCPFTHLIGQLREVHTCQDRGRRGETDPVRNFWFYDTVNVQEGLSFFSTYSPVSPQSHIALGYTIFNATLFGVERFLISYFV